MIGFKATFPNAEETLWPGQFVDVTVKLAEEPNALVIPSTAITEGQKGAQVFVVKGDIATLRPVEVERTVGDLSVITSGLEAGEQVITTGQLRVTSGGKVTVKKRDTAENDTETRRHGDAETAPRSEIQNPKS